MPVTRKITGRRGSEYWASMDFDDGQLLQALVKEEVHQNSILGSMNNT